MSTVWCGLSGQVAVEVRGGLAWLLGGDLPVLPVVGASSLAQLDEALDAVDLDLTAAQRARLDQA